MSIVEEFEHKGIAVEISYMECPENPRTDGDYHLTTLTQLDTSNFASPGGSDDQDRRIVTAWGFNTSREFVERYARAFLGAEAVAWFDDPRSSSRIFAYVTAEGMAKGWGDNPWTAEDAQSVVDSELSEYRAWCEGEVYGYIVAVNDSDKDSCWGYYELDYCIAEAKSVAEEIAADRAADKARIAKNNSDDEAEIAELVGMDM